eukprot:GHVT01068228.1.p1 GENE.GHVT01068228.1~~GHVT01068228.1.p1  ORF type:complete len:234 (+),score=18.58 GHVT01068228.1:2279-2980(+)
MVRKISVSRPRRGVRPRRTCQGRPRCAISPALLARRSSRLPNFFSRLERAADLLEIRRRPGGRAGPRPIPTRPAKRARHCRVGPHARHPTGRRRDLLDRRRWPALLSSALPRGVGGEDCHSVERGPRPESPTRSRRRDAMQDFVLGSYCNRATDHELLTIILLGAEWHSLPRFGTEATAADKHSKTFLRCFLENEYFYFGRLKLNAGTPSERNSLPSLVSRQWGREDPRLVPG